MQIIFPAVQNNIRFSEVGHNPDEKSQKDYYRQPRKSNIGLTAKVKLR